MERRYWPALFLPILLGGCGQQAAEIAGDCSARPAGFQSEDEFLATAGGSVPDFAANALRVGANGAIAWNGYPVDVAQADELLRQTAAQDAATRAYLHFEWEDGAPCDAVTQARALIDRHMQCATSGMCIEGPVSRLYPGPLGSEPTDPRP